MSQIASWLCPFDLTTACTYRSRHRLQTLLLGAKNIRYTLSTVVGDEVLAAMQKQLQAHWGATYGGSLLQNKGERHS